MLGSGPRFSGFSSSDCRSPAGRIAVGYQACTVMTTLTMHARLLMRSALSLKPNRAGGTCGCRGGCDTSCVSRNQPYH